MKKHVFFHRLLIILISLSMIFVLASCSQQKKPVPTTQSKESQNKPPKELDALNKAVEKLEKTLFAMNERSKKPLFIQQQEVKKEAAKKGGGTQSSGSSQGKDESSGGKGQGQGGTSGSSSQKGKTQLPSEIELVTPEDKLSEHKYESQQMKLEVDRANLQQFEKIKKDVVELHRLWNAYEAKAISQMIMQSSIVDFENALNNLTKAVKEADVYQSTLQVTQLYKYLPDFYMAYTSKSPPEIVKLRFAAKKIYLLGEKKDYGAAKEVLDYLTAAWLLTRPKLNQDSMDMINQFEFAVSDLKAAIEQKNDMIIAAKTEVILKVADKLEKANSKKK